MAKSIKMIGLDLDGTLLNSQKQLTEYTKSVLKQAIEQGVHVFPATGRPYSALPEELKQFPGMRYAVTANGARVMNLETMQIFYEDLLSVETSQKVLDTLKKYDTIYEFFADGIGYTSVASLQEAYEYFDVSHMAEYYVASRNMVSDVKEKLTELQRPTDKLQGIFRFVEEKKLASADLEKLDGITVTTAFQNNLEINKKGVDKGVGIRKLGEVLGIAPEEIMVCGDGMNDMAMMKAAGFAVAMGNAEEEIRSMADYVTVTNDEDGVARAIEKIVLS